MPTTLGREYRTMATPMTAAQDGRAQRFETDFYVEGLATTFNAPYCLYEYEGNKYYEMIDRGALAEADLSDVIMQYDHRGMVYARNKMGKEKPPCLLIEPQESGLFIAADLGLTKEARRLFESINSGLIYKMSWAFRVIADAYDRNTRTRTILKIGKVYDVSAVSYPANQDTDITARSYFDGVIEVEKREALVRERELLKLKLKLGGTTL